MLPILAAVLGGGYGGYSLNNAINGDAETTTETAAKYSGGGGLSTWRLIAYGAIGVGVFYVAAKYKVI